MPHEIPADHNVQVRVSTVLTEETVRLLKAGFPASHQSDEEVLRAAVEFTLEHRESVFISNNVLREIASRADIHRIRSEYELVKAFEKCCNLGPRDFVVNLDEGECNMMQSVATAQGNPLGEQVRWYINNMIAQSGFSIFVNVRTLVFEEKDWARLTDLVGQPCKSVAILLSAIRRANNEAREATETLNALTEPSAPTGEVEAAAV